MLKYQMILSPRTPSSSYNCKADVNVGRRPFLFAWLNKYDWFCYSSALKRAFCKFCVLFDPSLGPLDKGDVKGAFIKTAFCKYKKFHELSKVHSNSAWHNFFCSECQRFCIHNGW